MMTVPIAENHSRKDCHYSLYFSGRSWHTQLKLLTNHENPSRYYTDVSERRIAGYDIYII
jgi:hypothetical protein